MLYRVTGKFANNYTFTIPSIDATSPAEALSKVHGDEEIKNYESPVVMVTVKALGGSKKAVKISDKPAAERKKGGKKGGAATAPAAAAAAAPPAQSSGQTRRR